MIIAKKGHRPDYIFIFCVVILVIFGLIMLSSASSDIGKIKFNDTYYYLEHQIIYGLILGIIGFLIAGKINYKNFKRISIFLLAINVILLILLFTPLGADYKGSNRWLNLGSISVQPSEFLKISFIIYLAALLSKKTKQSNIFEGLLPFLITSSFIAFLVLKQPATTTVAIIIASALVVYFLSGAKLFHIIGVAVLGIILLSVVIYISPYRYQRIMTYFDSEKNIQTTGYQINQSLMAIGSGGLFGVGFGQSTTKYKYLPEPIGDSIFAVIAEELGFIGSIFLLGIYIILFIRGFLIAQNSSDQFARLTAIGFISIIVVQTFVHIASSVGFLPVTGVPLPFISYGGTSLAVFLTMTGIIVNISKYTS
ncbi:cell division protein FtsW [Candidatus Wolfebacteria bacterium RIFCSPLOWO2_01_FULL_38_11]|uniref:Probable peptidoglycan glycosyltransferase FtsW n=2 Tax=Candidatus Wolfeibacteriota TaxID=1752735 RepID=A0A0G0IGF0_9BACT|nr:MAG: Stage V sporulation protein E [Candidatus Wolfebacteria bacterium GW2011_GWC1_37_10]OGM91399.1 MAG: cell division protein FtsW [Candidatus Wolfebacteria bacterium RIFCSPLOWO2_01_FULL_38_11]